MDNQLLITELSFKAVRSSGPGGQHVNKTSSKIEVYYDVSNSRALSTIEKERLLKKLQHKLSKDGLLTLTCCESRSQHRNKAIVIERLLQLISENLKVQKRRRKTKPSNGAIEKRLRSKKNQALKKNE